MKYEIEQFNACHDAVKFRSGFATFQDAWRSCHRGDWMLWIARRVGVDRRKLFLAKGLCANTVRHLMKDERSIKAVDAAIGYGNGDVSDDELRSAAYAAYASADSAYAAYAAYASDSAAYAAYAAYASDSADAAAYKQNQQQTADICREILTEEVFRCLNIQMTPTTI